MLVDLTHLAHNGGKWCYWKDEWSVYEGQRSGWTGRGGDTVGGCCWGDAFLSRDKGTGKEGQPGNHPTGQED